MRAPLFLIALAGIAILSNGCGKGQSGGQAQSGVDATVAPAEPTPAQAKALQATLPAPYNTADLDNGKHQVAVCRSCHTLSQGGPNMTGPNLFGVFGRKAGSVASFNYSDGLKAAGFTWDADRINTWITDPGAMIQGTKMTFFGLRDAKDRADAIAYLKTQTSPLPN